MDAPPTAATKRISFRQRWAGLSLRRRIVLGLIVLAAIAGGVAGYQRWTDWPARAILTDGSKTWPLAFSPDGETLVTGGDSGLALWDAKTATRRTTWEGISGGDVFAGSYTPDGQTFCSLTYARSSNKDFIEVNLIETKTGRLRAIVPTKSNGWFGHVISSDGRRLRMAGLITATKIVEVVDVDLVSGQALTSRSLSCPNPIGSNSISPDGRFLAVLPKAPTKAAGSDVVIWDIDKDREVFRLNGPSGEQVRSLAFSDDGSTLAIGREGSTIEFWDLATRRLRVTYTPHSSEFDSALMQFSPDGTTLVSSGLFQRRSLTMNTARLMVAAHLGHRWRPPFEMIVLDTSSGHVLQRVISEGRATFSPDSRTLATGHIDGTVRLRDLPVKAKPSGLNP